MSYARFSKDSDVYVFLSVQGHFECCGCWLRGEECFFSTEAMLEHLSAHLDAGHKVPARTFDRLRENAEENDAYIAEGDPLEPLSAAPRARSAIDQKEGQSQSGEGDG